MSIFPRSALMVLSALFLSLAAEAREGTVGLIMTGEAYDGPPKFRLLADGREIGKGDVTSATDTGTGAKLEFKDGASPASNNFTFTVPDIDSVSYLDIEFMNDDWAGVGKPGDRNLYLLSLSVSTVRNVQNGVITTTREFLPTALQAVMPKPGGSDITSRFAALNNTGSFRLMRPKEGWGPGAVASVKLAATSRDCKLAPIEIKGFEKNAARLSPKMLDQLTLASKLVSGKSCKVIIRAFAAGGSDAFRRRLSLARAQMVATELARFGIPNENIRAEGATGKGRRVVISFQ